MGSITVVFFSSARCFFIFIPIPKKRGPKGLKAMPESEIEIFSFSQKCDKYDESKIQYRTFHFKTITSQLNLIRYYFIFARLLA
jgi:hypothetical protein